MGGRGSARCQDYPDTPAAVKRTLTPAAPTPLLGSGVDPRQRRSVVALLTSVVGSSTAMAALTVVLGKQVFDMTRSELNLGLLGLAEFAPSALLVFVSGPLADRFDRRRIAATGIVVEAVFVLA